MQRFLDPRFARSLQSWVLPGVDVGQARSRRRFRPRDESGFLLIDTLAALTILAIILIALVALLTASVVSEGLSRQRTLSEQLVNQEIERIRGLGYSSVGLVNGNPAGALAASTPVAVGGLKGKMTEQVKWVNDPASTSGFQTQADYKRVTVTISRVADGKVLSQQVTYVSSYDHDSFGGASWGTIKTLVVDMSNSGLPVSGVSVGLGKGPSAPLGDTTDASGTAVFPALTPTTSTKYEVSMTAPAGYVVLPDDAAPNPPAELAVAAGNTTNTTVRLYRPATLIFNVTQFGLPYLGATSVTLTSSYKSNVPIPASGTFTGGTYTAASTVAAPIPAGLQYTATANASGVTSTPVTQTVAYPADSTSTFNLALATPNNLTVTVQRRQKVSGSCQNAKISGATVTAHSASFNPPTGFTISGTSNASGVVAFAVPAKTDYSITATLGTATATLVNQTVTVSGTGITVTLLPPGTGC